MIPAGELVGLAAQRHGDALSLLAAADHREAERLGHGREQLVVLAEAEILDRRAAGERHALELDRAADPRAPRELRRVGREPVRDVELRVRDRGEAAALLEPERRARVTAEPELRARAAQRARDDEQ